ncbi:expressed unknown protein [Seminavis robusta]|uniref:CRAL-TRIO domain-containing protein n=1 Tax=Seminavis robusta TaxID=568900 RepID=A0A9N8DDW2_9STRA|nr:expressed unknown protein [Seminavis robusta]|eukprot:Sro43_g026361.1  (311) ;mRNA; r:132084-133016
MTSWPWMKGIEEAIADPIDPICPEDERPSVKELIVKHSEKIAKIKAALADDPLYDPSKHDDLWILRFWLSHKKSKSAIEAAKYTLEFRKKHNLDELDIRDLPPQHVKDGKLGEFKTAWKRDDAVVFFQPDPKRGVVAFLTLDLLDQHAMVEKFTEDYWLTSFLYPDEYSFQCLDYATRTTGRLTKTVRFVDCRGLTLGGFSSECSRRDGRTMALLENCYPQMLETIFACNAPSLIGAFWKLFSVVAPKRVVAKFDIIYPKENPKDLKKVLKHISEQNLPDFYGGKNPVSPDKWASEVTSDDTRAEVYWWW